MATTPALSPEPPTDLCPKLSTKMQIVVPSLKPSQVLQQSLKKKQEAIVRTPKPRCESTVQCSIVQPLKESPVLRNLTRSTRSEATLTMREEIPGDDGHSLPRF
ncbi:hypothetical protein E4U34_000634 [Claviceps purpurea]|nr:hypothetical protein E4U51_000782 [Claviceps purpurea]KAG6203191.1 hypothetical protein E4U34_000634 [Claviceps purpurea]KAG6259155.1 hypothetical protein E4U48_000521 [Claviceps purpurea]